MSELNQPNKNRRFHTPNKFKTWIPYIGNCKAVDAYLSSKDTVGWLLPKFLNALFRGVSQVVFANNPFTGLVILLALFLADVFVGLAAIAAATTAIITALLLKQDSSLISSGLTTYNAVLVGTVTSSLWAPLYSEALSIKLWVFIIIGSMLSVFVTSALANIFSSFKISLPCLTLPFNVVVLILFICLMPPIVTQNVFGFDNSTDVDAFQFQPDAPLVVNENNWGSIFSGIICSMGQVYGINNAGASFLMYVGLMIYSPLLCVMSFLGSCVSTLAGFLFAPEPYDAVYNGVWGYNGLLAAGAVGGFFIVITCHSFWTAMINVIFTVLIQQVLLVLFASMRLPVFTLPFVFSTLLFLSVSSSGEELPRVTEFSFPEIHRYEFSEQRRLRRLEKINNEQHVCEEKELVLKEVKVITEEKGENSKEHKKL